MEVLRLVSRVDRDELVVIEEIKIRLTLEGAEPYLYLLASEMQLRGNIIVDLINHNSIVFPYPALSTVQKGNLKIVKPLLNFLVGGIC